MYIHADTLGSRQLYPSNLPPRGLLGGWSALRCGFKMHSTGFLRAEEHMSLESKIRAQAPVGAHHNDYSYGHLRRAMAVALPKPCGLATGETGGDPHAGRDMGTRSPAWPLLLTFGMAASLL